MFNRHRQSWRKIQEKSDLLYSLTQKSQFKVFGAHRQSMLEGAVTRKRR